MSNTKRAKLTSKKTIQFSINFVLFITELILAISIFNFNNSVPLAISFIFIIVFHSIYCSKTIQHNYGYILIMSYATSILSWLSLETIRNYILPVVVILYLLNIIFWIFYNKKHVKIYHENNDLAK